MLMFSKDDKVISRNDLRNYDDQIIALQTRSHKPVPFARGIDIIQDVAEDNGIRFGEEQYALARNETQLFGMIEVLNFSNDTGKFCLGVRSSVNKTLPWSLCGGVSLAVCTNLDLFGSVVMKRKQTTFVMQDLRHLVGGFMKQFPALVDTRRKQEERYQQAVLKDSVANHAIIQMLRKDIINTQRVEKVVNEYYEPSHSEHLTDGQRTAWTLFNATTEAFKGSPVATYAERSEKLHTLIGQATDYALAA